MLRKTLDLLVYSSAVALSVALATPAWAQESAAAAPPSIDEVVVTARRVEENVQSVPLAVTAYSGDTIAKLVVNNVQDLNKLSPGLQTRACSGTRECNQPSIRGQGTGFATGEDSVINYFAEVAKFDPSTMDLGSLQVVKGPQGTLFGETATGGVILYEPRRPGEDELNGYVRAQAGNYSYGSIEAAVGAALVPDQLMWRAAAKWRSREGFTTAYSSYGAPPIDVDNVDSLEWRFALTARPTSFLENYFMYAGSTRSSNGTSSPLSYVDNRFMNPGAAGLRPGDATLAVPGVPFPIPSPFPAYYEFGTGVIPAPGVTWAQFQSQQLATQLAAGERAAFYNYSHKNEREFHGFVNQTLWDVTDSLTVRNIFGLYWVRQSGPGIDIDGGSQPLVDTRALVTPGSTSITNPNWAWTGGWPSRVWSDELQFQGKLFDERLDWQAGFYYRKQAQRDWQTESNAAAISVFGSPQGNPTNASTCLALGRPTGVPCTTLLSRNESENKAVYGQASFAVLDNLRLTAGLRHTWSARSVEQTFADTVFVQFKGISMPMPVADLQPRPGAPIIVQAIPDESVDTYTLAADWQVNDDLLLYATNRTGYKSGGINQNAPLNDPNRLFGQENLTDYEVGLKYDWLFHGVRGRTNLALFRDSYEDIQVSQIIPGTATTITVNAASATIQGAELEATLIFNDWFEIGGFYGWLDAKYDEYSEVRNCSISAEYWRRECFDPTVPALRTPALPAGSTRQVRVDNAAGTYTIVDVNAAGVANTIATYQGDPTQLANTAEHRFTLRPTLHLEPWLDKKISISAAFQYTSSQGTKNPYPGVTLAPPLPGSPFSSGGPAYRPSTFITDLRVEWSDVMDSGVDAALSVTNLTDETYIIGADSGFTIVGAAPAILSEPRMWYLELNYQF